VSTPTPPPLENHAEWLAAFRAGWLAHYQETGEIDWKRYVYPDNQQPISGPGVDLSRSRLALITSSGAYLPGHQPPFDAENALGDYSIRTHPLATPLRALDYAHTHYDQAAVREDPQVLIPVGHLRALAVQGAIGELAPTVIHFMGYQPDVSRVVDETAPAILEVLGAEGAQAALLVPA
jgi:hypothetical protein